MPLLQRGVLKVFLEVRQRPFKPCPLCSASQSDLRHSWVCMRLTQNLIRDACTYCEHARRKVCCPLLRSRSSVSSSSQRPMCRIPLTSPIMIPIASCVADHHEPRRRLRELTIYQEYTQPPFPTTSLAMDPATDRRRIPRALCSQALRKQGRTLYGAL